MFEQIIHESGFSMDRLANFCAVADAGSIATVAPHNPSRQSLISRQIRELEGVFGVDLVRRKGRGLELTAAGIELAVIGRQNLKGLADFAAGCAGAPWSARLVASNSVAYWLLLPRLGTVRERMPDVRVDVYHEQTREIVTMTREGTYDVAFVHGDAIGNGLESAPLGEVGHSLLVPKSLAERKPRSVKLVLSSIPLAVPVGGKMRSIIDGLATEAGATPQVAVGCSSYLQAAQLVASGTCAAALPDLALSSLDERHFHRFPLPYRYILCLAWSARNANTRQQLARLIGELQEVVRL